MHGYQCQTPCTRLRDVDPSTTALHCNNHSLRFVRPILVAIDETLEPRSQIQTCPDITSFDAYFHLRSSSKMWSRTVRVPQTCICEFRHTASRASLPHVAPVTTPGLRRRNASTSDKSFQGQLYDSTQQRVIREKAEQARFAEIRESRKAARGSGAWVPPFGMSFNYPARLWPT